MMEWWWNDKRFWRRLCWSTPSLSIPVIFSHFEMTLWSFHGHSDTEWPQNDWNDAGMTIFSFSNDFKWLEWGWNDSNFWSKANALDFFLSHSALIQSIFYHSWVIPMQKLILMSFHHYRLIPLSSHHYNVIPSVKAHSIVIQSFWCHFIIQNLKTRGLCTSELAF